MIDNLFEERENAILKSRRRNQEIHLRYVEEAKKKELDKDTQSPQRYPHEFNKRYFCSIEPDK